MDLILAGYVWADKNHFYLYVLLAAAGSALGGLIPFLLGRAGGELFLMKRIDRARYEQLRDRFEKQEFLAMMIPSILPPPTPWKLFVFAAGVFEMKVGTFVLSVFAGRVIRDLITAILTIEYGPEIVHIAARLATRHRVVLVAGLTVLLAALVYWIWQTVWKRRGKKDGPGVDTVLAKLPK
jgi:membrane protein YqaA with SNARE-associated domain